MSKKPEVGDVKDLPPDDTDNDVDEIADELRATLAGLGKGGGKVQVLRKRVGRRDSYLETLEAAELREDPLGTLKELYGGGEFRLVLKDSKGQFIRNGTHTVSIEGPPKIYEPEPPEPADDIDRRVEERLAELMDRGVEGPQLVRELRAEMRAFLEEARNPPRGAAEASFAEMALNLVTAFQTANAPIIEALLSRRDDGMGLREQVETLGAVVSLMRELNPSSSSEDGVMGTAVRTLAPSLGRLFDAHVAQQAGQPVQPNPAQPAMAVDRAPGAPAPPWYPLMQPWLPTLLRWAEAGKDPELRADVVVEDLPDEHLEPIYNQLQRGEVFTAEFFQAVPQALPHRAWFETFFAGIRAGIQPPEEAPGQAQAGGDS